MKIFVRAKVLAREERIERVDDTHFIIWVKEPPVNGLANKAIEKCLADYFVLARNNVKIIAGFNKRNKIVLIDK